MTVKIRSKNLCSVTGKYPRCTETVGTGECIHRDGLMYSCNWKAPHVIGIGRSNACTSLEAIEEALKVRDGKKMEQAPVDAEPPVGALPV